MNSILKELGLLVYSLRDKSIKSSFINVLQKLKNEAKKTDKELKNEEKERKRLLKQLKKEDLERRKQSQRQLRKLMKIRGYWTKEANNRALQQKIQEEEAYNPIHLLHKTEIFKRYRINNLHSTTIEGFLELVKSKVIGILFPMNKCIYTLEITLFKYTTDEQGKETEVTRDHYFTTKAFVLLDKEDIHKSYDGLPEHFNRRLVELETRESGWMLKSINHLDIKLAKYKPLKGGCITTRLPPGL